METSNKLTGEQLSLWTSSAVDIPVSHSAQQENEEEQTTQDISGDGFVKPLANYDPDSQSWKMSEDISLWGEYKLLESLPKSGMTRNGVLYQQPEWVRPIDEIESLLWPTPTTQENEHPNATWNEKLRRVAPNGSTHGINLADAVQKWPTPQARDYKGPSGRSMKGLETDLPMAVQKYPTMWGTPRAAQGESRNHTIYARESGKPQNLENQIAQREPSAIGGKLNPAWVEWLMGFPIGWTDLED